MKRIMTWAIIASGLGLACGGTTPMDPGGSTPPPPPQPPPLPTYVVAGTITDAALRPIAGVNLTVPLLPRWARGASLDDGTFAFSGVRGGFILWLDKEGYVSQTHVLFVTADLQLDLTMQPLVISDEIQLGQTTQYEVLEGAHPCDRLNWDAHAPCRRFRFVAPFRGRLRLELLWGAAEPELDVLLVTPDGVVSGAPHAQDPTRQVLEASVTPGTAYEVRVNSYYGGQTFYLTATMTP